MTEQNTAHGVTTQALETVAVAHVLGQHSWHDPAQVIANRAALVAMRDAIDQALAEGAGKAQLVPYDGEGFMFHVQRLDKPFGDKAWDEVGSPYTQMAFWDRDAQIEDMAKALTFYADVERDWMEVSQVDGGHKARVALGITATEGGTYRPLRQEAGFQNYVTPLSAYLAGQKGEDARTHPREVTATLLSTVGTLLAMLERVAGGAVVANLSRLNEAIALGRNVLKAAREDGRVTEGSR